MGRSQGKKKHTEVRQRDFSRGVDSIWKPQRNERVNHSPSNLPNVDVHGILFAVVAVVFVVYPLIQWALGR